MMEQKFLNGKDYEWANYKEIDNDVSLDDIDQLDRTQL